ELWIVPLSGDKKPVPYIQSAHFKAQAQFSPDGKWVAYTTDEFGKPNVVVQPFPDPNQGKRRVSVDGGAEPRWRRDGHELFYLASDGKLMAVPVNSGAAFEFDKAIALFQTPLSVGSRPSPTFRYDVMPDGQRFLIIAPATSDRTETRPTSNPI